MVTLTPICLNCEKAGTYSMAFSFKGVNTIVAENFNIDRPNKEYYITSAMSFECPIDQINQSVIIYLLDDHKELLTGGVIPIFSEFHSLEPSITPEMIFEPQELK